MSLAQIESAVSCLFDQHKVVAEGAGACGLAAAMFHEKALEYDRIVAVVCGGCIDTKELFRILTDVETSCSATGPTHLDKYSVHAARATR